MRVVLFFIFYVILLGNFSFYNHLLEVYNNYFFILSLYLLIFFITLVLLSFVYFRYLFKIILVFIFIASSQSAYFMDTYNVIIDSEMLRNAIQTNINEAKDLISLKQFLYLFFMGIIPSYFIMKSKINYSIKNQLILFILPLILIVITIFSFNKTYTSFFREHKPLRYYSNPTYWIYSTFKYIKETYFKTKYSFKILDNNPIQKKINKTQKIVIFVVGEASRWDHFSLNGYNKETNPLLKKYNIINFSNFFSCGTSTAISVPCMFSIYNKDSFSWDKAYWTQNVLDLLKKAGVLVYWRDNNSDSKGVALRVDYKNYKTNPPNQICDIECRDIGMLKDLDKIIKSTNKDIIIILHQMGNHGPAYYKRYPKEFEKFKPVCKSNELQKCFKDEIINSYDNGILYTDYFLDKTIKFLKQFKDKKTMLFYVSDHGESLGENGIYLHGMPYFIAPENQKHVGAFLWINKKFQDEININKLKQNSNKLYYQEIIFHSLLGIFNIKTKVYNKRLDIFETK